MLLAQQQENRGILDEIVSLLAALYHAIRNGFARLAESIRRQLERFGYYQYA